ncbi:glycosyltransferase [Sulfurimonas sp.]
MKVSVIVTTYKDLETLKLVLDSLLRQDYNNFEVVIAEDDNAQETVDFLQDYKLSLDISHISHPDTGRRKTTIQNKAVVASKGEYLIFIDGDVLVHSKFISSQVLLAKKQQVLAGRRLNLDEKTSNAIRKGSLSVVSLEKYYWLFALKFMFKKEFRFEQGIYISPQSFLYKLFLAKRKRAVAILGCNWSCFKEDFVNINGFDEGYENSSIAEDTDLDWRFQMAGYKVKSSKNVAVVYHLFHKKSDSLGGLSGHAKMQNNKAAGKFFCERGINTHVK